MGIQNSSDKNRFILSLVQEKHLKKNTRLGIYFQINLLHSLQISYFEWLMISSKIIYFRLRINSHSYYHDFDKDKITWFLALRSGFL